MQCRYRYRFGLDYGAQCSEEVTSDSGFCLAHTPVKEKPAHLQKLLAHGNYREADFAGCDLAGASLTRANLTGADLRGADLRDADLRGANLVEARFEGANLSGADLWGAQYHLPHLLQADLSGANLTPVPPLRIHALPPQTIFAGKYVTEGRLGGGSFGLVYKMRDVWGTTPYSIKILNPKWYGEEGTIKRFRRQEEIMQRVDHPNVVPIFDVSYAESVYYIVMPFLDGRNLQVSLAEERIAVAWPLDAKIQFFFQLLSGLAALAEQNILHRDLKPSNIMVLEDKTPVLVDFELAKFLDRSALSHSHAPGTLRYWSPEHEHPLSDYGEYSDIYSLGLIAYELLTGSFPRVKGSTDAYRWDRTDLVPADPREVNPELPEKLAVIVMKMLEHPIERRYSRFSDVMEDLEPLLGSSFVSTISEEVEPISSKLHGAKPNEGAEPLLVVANTVAEEPRTKTLVPETYVKITGATFQRGTTLAEIRENSRLFRCRSMLFRNETPTATVTVQDFEIAVTPVTNGEFLAYCQATRRKLPAYFAQFQHTPEFLSEPVRDVAFQDAARYCRWAKVELPTEDEWELAAKGTERRRWPWGNDPPTTPRACVNSTGPRPVGSYPDGATPDGFLDMAGNVWEWTATQSEIYKGYRIAKGGSWADSLAEVRGSARFPLSPSATLPFLGFRVVRRRRS